jgi:hypothetical protein
MGVSYSGFPGSIVLMYEMEVFLEEYVVLQFDENSFLFFFVTLEFLFHLADGMRDKTEVSEVGGGVSSLGKDVVNERMEVLIAEDVDKFAKLESGNFIVLEVRGGGCSHSQSLKRSNGG